MEAWENRSTGTSQPAIEDISTIHYFCPQERNNFGVLRADVTVPKVEQRPRKGPFNRNQRMVRKQSSGEAPKSFNEVKRQQHQTFRSIARSSPWHHYPFCSVLLCSTTKQRPKSLLDITSNAVGELLDGLLLPHPAVEMYVIGSRASHKGNSNRLSYMRHD